MSPFCTKICFDCLYHIDIEPATTPIPEVLPCAIVVVADVASVAVTIATSEGVCSNGSDEQCASLSSSPIAEGKISGISLELKVNAGHVSHFCLATSLKIGGIEFFDRRVLENEEANSSLGVGNCSSISVTPMGNHAERADAWNDRPRETLLIGRVPGLTNDSSSSDSQAPHVSATFSVPICALTALTGGHTGLNSNDGNRNGNKESAVTAHISIAPTRVAALPAPTMALMHAIDVLMSAAAAATATKSTEAHAAEQQHAREISRSSSASHDRSSRRNMSGNFVERDGSYTPRPPETATAITGPSEKRQSVSRMSPGPTSMRSFAPPRDREDRRHGTQPNSSRNTMRRATSEPLHTSSSPATRNIPSSEAVKPPSLSQSHCSRSLSPDLPVGPGVGCKVGWLQDLIPVPVKVKLDIAPCEMWALDGCHAILVLVNGALEASLLPHELTMRGDAVHCPRNNRKTCHRSDAAGRESNKSGSGNISHIGHSSSSGNGEGSINLDSPCILSARAAPFVTLDLKAGASMRAGPLDAQPLKADRCTELTSLPNLTVAYKCRALTLKDSSSSPSAMAVPAHARTGSEGTSADAHSPTAELRLVKLAHSMEVNLAPLSMSLNLATLAPVIGLIQRLSMEWAFATAAAATAARTPASNQEIFSSSSDSIHHRKRAVEWARAKENARAKNSAQVTGATRHGAKQPSLQSGHSLSHSKNNQATIPSRRTMYRTSSSQSPRNRTPLHSMNNTSSTSSSTNTCPDVKEGSDGMPVLDSWSAALLLLSEMDVHLRSGGVHLVVVEPSAIDSNMNYSPDIKPNANCSSSSGSSGNDSTGTASREKAVLQVSLASLEGTAMLRHAGRRSALLIGPIAADGSARIASPTATLSTSPTAPTTAFPTTDAGAGAAGEVVVAAGAALGTLSIGLQPHLAAWYWHRGLECWEPLIEPWSVSLGAQLQLASLVQLPQGVPSAVPLPARLLPTEDEVQDLSSSAAGWADNQVGEEGAPSESLSGGVHQSPGTSAVVASASSTPLTPRLQAARLAAALAWDSVTDSPRALSQSLSDAFLATLEKVGVARRSSSISSRSSGGDNANPSSAPPSPGLSAAFDLNAAAGFEASDAPSAAAATTATDAFTSPAEEARTSVGSSSAVPSIVNSSLDSLRGRLPDPLDDIKEDVEEDKNNEEDEDDIADEDDDDELDGTAAAAVAVAVASPKRLEINVSEALLESTAQLLASCANVTSGGNNAAMALENNTGSKLWFSTSSSSSFGVGINGGTFFVYSLDWV